MFNRLFKKEEKTIKKARTYKARIAWVNDTPWYLDNATKKDLDKFRANPYVLDVLVLG
jgi:hypothetical protein